MSEWHTAISLVRALFSAHKQENKLVKLFCKDAC